MSKTSAVHALSTNRLLEALPKSDYQRLLPSLRPFLLVFGETIYAPNDLIRHIYFPTSGIISLLAVAEERTSLEVGLVGQEGMAGLPVFMEVKTSRHTAVVQGAGNAFKMRTNDFRKECDNGGSLVSSAATLQPFAINPSLASRRLQPVPPDRRAARQMASDDTRSDEYE